MSLTEAQIQRYARHILLPDIGGVGQARLLASSAVVAVGPARPAAAVTLAYLAAGGVGRLLVAGDAAGPVAQAEIRRNLLLAAADAGRPRADALRDRLGALNPDVAVTRGESAADLSVAPYEVSPEEPSDPDDLASALIAGGSAAARALGALARSA